MIVRKADVLDVQRLGPRMRWEDRIEATLASGLPPEVALKNSFHESDMCWAIERNFSAVAIAGVGAANEKTKGLVGVPWLLSSDELRTRPCQTMTALKQILQEIKLLYPMLINFVFADNKVAIKMLCHLGFKIADEPIQYGEQKVLFYRFWMGF